MASCRCVRPILTMWANALDLASSVSRSAGLSEAWTSIGEDRGDVHRRWKRVVRRLRTVDVVVRMDGTLAAHLSTAQLDCTVRDDLVHVHVGLGSGARLPDDERKVVVQLPLDDLVRGADDEIANLRIEVAELVVRNRGCLFEDSKRANDLGRHLLGANSEVHARPHGLCAVVLVRRNLDGAHRIGFDTRRHMTSGRTLTASLT